MTRDEALTISDALAELGYGIAYISGSFTFTRAS